jgi:hypothetical protein
MQVVWTKNRPNLLAPDNLARIENEISHGLILAHHYHFYGGRSRDEVAFDQFDGFMSYISLSKPGDAFTIWSLNQLLAKKLEIATAKYSPQSRDEFLILPAASLRLIEEYLGQKYNEINGVYYLPNSAGPLKARTYDQDMFGEFLVDVRSYSKPGGEVYIFSEEVIYQEVNILLDAKYPNAEGEVPIGGAY